MLKKLISSQTNRGIAGLFISNIIAFLVTGISYIIYSRALTPSEFGIYSIALLIGNFGTLVLDGGLKNTIIKLQDELKSEEEEVLLFLMASTSVIAIFILILIYVFLLFTNSDSISDYQFLSLFGGIYWLSYPWIAIPTAKLEHSLAYTGIATVESIGIVLERAMPALFILLFEGGIYSFIWSLIISRVFRVLSMNLLHRSNIRVPSLEQIRSIYHLLIEGGWLQIAVIASLLRDNLHTIIVGAMFGKAWVGYYSWALQLSAISSQIFVQIAARVSIPIFARAQCFEERWKACIYQIKILTITIVPFLNIILLIIPYINHHYFDSKWTISISLLPLLFLRMLPGLATTPLGSIVMVDRGGRAFAYAIAVWTLFETISAYLSLKFLGPMGLGYSYSIGVWLGVYFLLYFLDQRIMLLIKDILKSLLRRSCIFVSISLSCAFYAYRKLYLSHADLKFYVLTSIMILLCSYLSEKDIRKFIGVF
jgi:O-antigen/teichoic acid export membrane protein